MSAPDSHGLRVDRVLVATDFSACATEAVDVAVGLARWFDAELFLLHVLPTSIYGYLGFESDQAPIDWFEDARRAARSALTKETGRIVWPKVRTLLHEGEVVHAILAAAREIRADLVVIGTHGRSGFARAMLGSVAERVVRESGVPVMTVRGRR